MRIDCGEGDRWKHRFLYRAIMEKAKALDLAGAMVFRGLMWYEANSRIDTAFLVDLSGDSPVLVEMIDREEYIAELPPFLNGAMTGGMITIDDVEGIQYGRRPPKR